MKKVGLFGTFAVVTVCGSGCFGSYPDALSEYDGMPVANACTTGNGPELCAGLQTVTGQIESIPDYAGRFTSQADCAVELPNLQRALNTVLNAERAGFALVDLGNKSMGLDSKQWNDDHKNFMLGSLLDSQKKTFGPVITQVITLCGADAVNAQAPQVFHFRGRLGL